MAIPVLSSAQVKLLDAATMQSEPISSADLMERAAYRLCNALFQNFPNQSSFHIIAGPGNNGGDGLCMARILASRGNKVTVSLAFFSKMQSEQNREKLALLQPYKKVKLKTLNRAADLQVQSAELLVDCLFGSGLNGELLGEFNALVQEINKLPNTKVSVDIPSGLLDDAVQKPDSFVNANYTLAIEFPRPALLYNQHRLLFEVVQIGLVHNPALRNTKTFYLHPFHSATFVDSCAGSPNAFANKGTNGHALLIGGLNGKHGAILLAAEACLQHGVGLVTVLSDPETLPYLSNLPEAMFELIANLQNLQWNKYQSIAIGPGLGMQAELFLQILQYLKSYKGVLILDADALNILAAKPEMQNLLPEKVVFTPHPGEQKRLFGEFAEEKAAIEHMREFANSKKWFILAKNKYSYLFTPQGITYINGSGSAALAKGGSGDKLTGRIAAYAAKTQNPEHAAICGMFRV